jgi:hypothetical protein
VRLLGDLVTSRPSRAARYRLYQPPHPQTASSGQDLLRAVGWPSPTISRSMLLILRAATSPPLLTCYDKSSHTGTYCEDPFYFRFSFLPPRARVPVNYTVPDCELAAIDPLVFVICLFCTYGPIPPKDSPSLRDSACTGAGFAIVPSRATVRGILGGLPSWPRTWQGSFC